MWTMPVEYWGAAAGAPSLGPIGTKITSYWDMSESGSSNRNDSKGTNHAIASSAAVTTRVGVRGGGDVAVSLDGTCWLSIDSNSTIQVPAGGGNHEMFGWVYFTNTTGTPFAVSKWNGLTAAALEYGIDVEGGVMYGYNGGSAYYYNATTPTPGTGTWRFCSVWRDSADGKVRLQMDNGTVHVSASASNPSVTVHPLQFGAVNGLLRLTGGLQMWGWIKGDILTAAERTTLYNSGSGKTWAEIVSGGL